MQSYLAVWWIGGVLSFSAIGCSGDNPPAVESSEVVNATQPDAQLASVVTNSIGLKLVRIPAGEFLMGSAVSDPGAREDVERILCFDAVTGKPLWSHAYPVDYSGVSYDNGPRATPTVFQDRVYALGAVGQLFCLDAATGELVWSQDLVADFGTRVPKWGLSASPVVF